MSTDENRVEYKQSRDTGIGQSIAGESSGQSGILKNSQPLSSRRRVEGQTAPPTERKRRRTPRKWLWYVVSLLLVGGVIGGGWWWFAQARAGEGKPTDPPEATAGNGQQGMSQRGAAGSPGPGGMKGGKQAKPLLVEVQRVRRGEVVQFLQVSGEMVATEAIVVAATKEGPITFCPWREGDSVRAGEKLIEIDRAIHRAEIEAAEASLAVASAKLADLKAGTRPEEIQKAEAEVRRWEATRAFCEKELARESRLMEYEAASQSSLEQWSEKLAVAEAELDAARESLRILNAGPTPTEIAVQSAAVDEATARLNLAKAHLAECTIVAPFTGTITNVHVRPGDLAVPRSPLLEMYAHESLVVRFSVSEAHAAAMRPGLRATVTLDALPSRTFSAEVIRVYPQLDSAMRTRTVEARLTEPGDFVPHMFARLKIELERAEDAVLLPAEAVITTPSGDHFVFVVDQGKAQRRNVEIGLQQEGTVQAISGVEFGQHVVVAGHAAVRDGQPVRTAGEGQPPDRHPVGGQGQGAGKSAQGQPSSTGPSGKGGRG
jgi:multidrug resistance efflux pump